MTGSAEDGVFLAAVGVRQTMAVLLPVRLAADPPWTQGPLTFTHEGRTVADAAARQWLFTPAAARALYERRWHRSTAVTQGPLRLDGMELLRTPSARVPQQALAVLHFTVEGAPLLPVLRAFSGRRQSPDPDPLTGALDPAALLDGVADTGAPAGALRAGPAVHRVLPVPGRLDGVGAARPRKW